LVLQTTPNDHLASVLTAKLTAKRCQESERILAITPGPAVFGCGLERSAAPLHGVPGIIRPGPNRLSVWGNR